MLGTVGKGVNVPISGVDYERAVLAAAAPIGITQAAMISSCEGGKQRCRAAAARGVPVFGELSDAAEALACPSAHERSSHEKSA